MIVHKLPHRLPNGPELSCGGELHRRRNYSARGRLSPTVDWLFRAANSSTAISVSLSDWLGTPHACYFAPVVSLGRVTDEESRMVRVPAHPVRKLSYLVTNSILARLKV